MKKTLKTFFIPTIVALFVFVVSLGVMGVFLHQCQDDVKVSDWPSGYTPDRTEFLCSSKRNPPGSSTFDDTTNELAVYGIPFMVSAISFIITRSVKKQRKS